MRRPRRTAGATAARYKIVEFIIYPSVLQQSNILYFPRFGIFFLFEKEKQTRSFTPRPRERRAAVHSLCCSVGSSAHSPANALELERVRARAACKASRSALSKHSRLSPLERALCSLFFANIASLYPPPAALRRRCPRPQIARFTAARLLEACSSGFIKSFALLL